MRITGTLKFYNSAKGFGFITPEDGSKDVFVHASALEKAGIQSLNEGDKVSFVLEDDRKGRGKQAGRNPESLTLSFAPDPETPSSGVCGLGFSAVACPQCERMARPGASAPSRH